MNQQASPVQPPVAMRRALAAALRGPAVDPNPRVGAVVVDASGRVAGVGHHAGAGTPHAEVVALREAGVRSVGATVYVTLEPCAHTGRTPPCTDALQAAGVAEVRYAVADPSAAAGGGAARLRRAGVAVGRWDDQALTRQAEEIVSHFLHAARHDRPFVTWKVAATLDGRVAAADGSSAWITSEQARADVHELRAACGAVAVGTGTALADDPALTARHPDGTARERQPLRVVVGRRDLPPGARVADGSAPTLHVRTREPREVLQALHERQVRRVLLEGGPSLAAAFWRARLVDEVVAYLAPALLGAGPALVADLGISTIADVARLEYTDVRQLGPDVRLTARPHPSLRGHRPTLEGPAVPAPTSSKEH